MQYSTQTLNKYLKDLSVKLAAPGGGSAAALSGAMGSALLSMVVNFTLGKPRYAAFEKELKNILAKSESSRKKFLALLDADVRAYRAKNKAKSLAVPLEVAELASSTILLCRPLVKKGNVNLISDVAVAASLLESAFTSAAFNAEINLKDPDNRKLASKIRRRLGQMSKAVKEARTSAEENFGKVIRG